MSTSASWYERHILPHLIDCACGMPQVDRERAQVVPRAHGRVLEIGIGSGRNLRHYCADHVQCVQGLDPAMAWDPKARKRAEAVKFPVTLLPLSAETIPEADASFDCVVCTYTLCTIPDPAQALREFRRVLKPDGMLLFSEHGRAPDAGVRNWQRRLEPVWKRIAGGCHLTRDVPALLGDAGFVFDELEHRYLSRPRFLTYNYRGVARPG